MPTGKPLDEDEEIVWSEKLHESSLIPALVIGLPLSLVLIGLFIIAGAYLQRKNTKYVVTALLKSLESDIL
ncbi:membrane-flanked domain protein [Halorubrum sp. AJ67]|nr:membrane-flanked domain protein [Halorubrum sp. AJ67]